MPAAGIFYERGALVWYFSPQDSWLPARFIAQKGVTAEIQMIDIETGEVPEGASSVDVDLNALVEVQSEKIPPEVEDMVSLTELNEPSMLHNLRKRFSKGIIYTYVGSILVSVNPYRPNPEFYSESTMKNFHNKPLTVNSPHIYAIADKTFRNLMKDKKNQSVLISGESGAGKTEATKYLMRFLSNVTGEAGKIETSLFHAHPILEAFGNAKTRQNDNSSRFGKFFQIYFRSNGQMSQVHVSHYLLEKSRVVFQAEGEGNYHIFYYVLAGIEDSLRSKLSLKSLEDYSYANKGGYNPDPSIAKKNYQEVRDAMTSLGISSDDQDKAVSVLATVLHIGSLNFQKGPRNDAAILANKDLLAVIANILGVPASSLETTLCSRNMAVGGAADVVIPLKLDEAESGRDAFAKALYGKLFEWVMDKINESLGSGVDSTAGSNFIGILDIFGFETFPNNSFEQFCINYSNEQLQQFFNKYLFKMEQDEYIKEKIQWTKFTFEDNSSIIELIEKKPIGILSVLDEECSFPKGTDMSFLEKCQKLLGTHPKFSKPLRVQGVFSIAHYAAEVAYNVNGFLAKNKDHVNVDLVNLLQKSNQKFVSTLFSEPSAEATSAGSVASPAAGAGRGAGLGRGAPTGPAPTGPRTAGVGRGMVTQQDQSISKGVTGGSGKKSTIGIQFKQQLQSLLTILGSTESHFIRAIKPNHVKQHGFFDGMNVLRQLSYSGLMESIRIRGSGYSYRPTFEEFISRFGVFLPKGKNFKDVKAKCETIMDEKDIDNTRYQLGLTKIFLKENEYNYLMDKREEELHKTAKKIQRVWNNYITRKTYIKMQQGALGLQGGIRVILAMKELKNLRVERARIERELRLQREKEERERKEREEKEKREREAREKREREEKERREKEEAEERKRQAEREEKERKEREKREKEERERKEAAERREAERLAKLEADRKEAERIEKERVAAENARIEAERVAFEKAQAARAEADRKEAERVEAVRQEELKKEREKKAAEQKEKERIAAIKAEEERKEQERLEEEREEKERVEYEARMAEIKEAEAKAEKARVEERKALQKLKEEERLREEKEEERKNEEKRLAEEAKIEKERRDEEKRFEQLQKQREKEAARIQEEEEEKENKREEEELRRRLDESNQFSGEDIMPAFESEESATMGTYRKGMSRISTMSRSAGNSTLSRVNTQRFNKMAKEIDNTNVASVKTGVTFDLELEYKKLIFNSIEKPPLLQIPDGSTFTKYDYSRLRSVPFSFVVPPEEPEETKPPMLVIAGDQFNNMDEPDEGLQPEGLDLRAYERERADFPFVRYVPTYWTFPDDVPPARDLKDYKPEEIVDGFEALRKSDPDKVRVINASKLNKKDFKDFIKKANYCTKAEVLIITDCEFKGNISYIRLNGLRHVDLSGSQMSELSPALDCFKCSPHLESVVVKNNSCWDQKEGALDKLLAACPYIKKVNGKQVEVDHYLKAINNRGSKSQKKDIELMAWDLHFSKNPVLPSMKCWEPALITSISLPNCKLTTFHVGTLKSLEELDLSKNLISSLLGCGLEQCSELKRANFANNFINKRVSLQVFQYTPALTALNIKGNKDQDSGADFTDYRLYLIYITRNLKGTNRCPGLIEIDEAPVSLDDRINAIEKYSKKKKEGLVARYALGLIDYYGHHQMRSPNFLNNIKHLQLQRSKLQMVDLKGMYSLELLDLAGNDLKEVDGLKELLRLRVLNLSGNSMLELDKTLKDLSEHLQLEQVSFAILGNEAHPHYIKSKSYRERILNSLLPKNRYLGWIDNVKITIQERIATMLKMPGYTKNDAEKYRFELALIMNNVNVSEREYHYSVSAIGVQYQPERIISMKRLSSLKLRGSALDFRQFIALEELNLSGNKIVSFTSMGLEKLPNLKVLDLSNNRINAPLQEIATYLDTMKSLECIALRGNPSMQTKEDRFNLIGLMKSMREVTCRLQVIDIFVTIDERIEAWIANGGNKSEAELMRYNAIMYQRMPAGMDPKKLVTLDLSDAGFKKIDVSPYPNLHVLLLKGNLLKKLDGTGIAKLQKLTVLNLQNNRLKSLEKVAALIKSLPKLQSVGLSGNLWPTTFFVEKNGIPGWRQKLLTLIPELHKHRMPLKMIDDDPISVDEILDAWKLTKTKEEDPRHFRFHVLMLTKIPQSDPNQVQELDFSSCGLSTVDLSKYRNLIKLSLANNNFKSLVKSTAVSLSKLRGFDLSNNQIKDIEEIVHTVKNIPNLQVLMTYGNPCFEQDPEAARIEFLSKMFQHVQPQKLALVYLNGKRVTTKEKCSALTKTKTDLPKEAIELIRLEMAFQELSVKEGDTELDLTGFEFSSLTILHKRLPKLTHLNLSNNRLRILDPEVFKGLPNLNTLDLSYNELGGIKEITDVIKHCPKLEHVVLLKSTAGKETHLVKDYAFNLFKVLKNMVTIDGMKNPFATVAKRQPKGRQKLAQMDLQDGTPSFSNDSAEPMTKEEEQLMENLSSMYSKDGALTTKIKNTHMSALYRPRADTVLESPIPGSPSPFGYDK
eukprot:TRINITY_DN842_c0_g1_i1.p1 TRINITY_DN842_c0_g1~~TRINITY_DN842_c0_g1_i1.p1  ORF type:complete len:2518 (-),score=1170.22 TRINITY_DN842_c0_g1_i1:41-7594(-)